MNAPTDWVPGLIAVAVATVIAVIAAMRIRRDAHASDDLTGRDLEADWQSLCEQLRAVRSAETDDPELAHQRYALELRAAAQLKAMSMNLEKEETNDEPSESVPAARASWVGAAWGAAAMCAIFVPLLLVQQFASERTEGGSVTGNTGPAGGTVSAPMGKRPALPAPDPALKPLHEAIKANPKDVAARIRLIRAQIGRRRFVPAFEQAAEVLRIDPNNAQAKTFSAIVRIEMGMSSKATGLLSEALKTDPTLVEAWIYRGVANLQNGEAQAALDDWNEAIVLRPDSQTVLAPLMERAKGVLSGDIKIPARPTAGPSGANPHAPKASAAQPPAPSNFNSKPAAAVGPVAKVTINLAPGAEAKKGAVLFVIARAAGSKGGPPAAVKRLSVGDFPIQVELSAADAMMGGALPQNLDITARVDGDGNPLTKNDGVRGSVSAVILGGAAVSLTLAPQ
jgi:cytochrome c-type biogenesis protein CcmH/NrfG